MRIRLHTRAQHPDGHWIERGEVTDWPDKVKPPHGMQQKSADLIDYDPKNGLDANHTSGDVVDVALYDVIEEEKHDSKDAR